MPKLQLLVTLDVVINPTVGSFSKNRIEQLRADAENVLDKEISPAQIRGVLVERYSAAEDGVDPPVPQDTHIVIAGNPVDGLFYYGPFANGNDATQWADDDDQADYWTTKLTRPTQCDYCGERGVDLVGVDPENQKNRACLTCHSTPGNGTILFMGYPISPIKRLAQVNGTVTIRDGIAHLESGETLDLGLGVRQ